MYYHLKSEYCLRGWKRLPCAIVNSHNGAVGFFNADGYQALKLAVNGIEEDSLLFTDKQRNILEDAVKEGILEKKPEVSRLNQEQKYVEYPSRFIRSAHWSITGKCNYRCKHCYMSAPHAKYEELPLETSLEIIHQLAECGVQRVSLTGGEALVHPNFWEIVDELRENNIHISVIYSNGWKINRQVLEKLEQRDMHPEINISFDGVGCHDWMRGMPGAEDAAVEAFRICREMGFPTGAEYCLYRGNENKLRESVNLLASLGVGSLKISPVENSGEWKDNGYGETMTLSQDEIYQTYLSYLPYYFEDGQPLALQLSELFYSASKDRYSIPGCKGVKAEQAEHYCLCGHARTELYISADGRWLPCMPISGKEKLAEQFPKASEIPLKEALEQSFYISSIEKKLSEYLEHNEECRKCPYCFECAAGCRGRAATSEDYMAKDSAICIMFHGGYIAKLEDMMNKIGVKKLS